MTTLTIEKIGPKSVEALKDIARQSFLETYANENSEADMLDYLDEKFNHDRLITELENTESSFYFAKLENKNVGYLKLNSGEAQTEGNDINAVEIERIYVLAEVHGKRIGQALYNKALEFAKERNAPYIWLGVWEENPKAIQFYKKNNFVVYDTHSFVLGSDTQRDLMMKLEL